MENKKRGGLKEFCRKFMVSLKRRPSMIPLVVIVIAFLVYSLNLTHISDTTALIQGTNMGLSGFATMLFSMLSFLVFMNTFPYRKKTNIPMLVILYAMLAIIIYCDISYLNNITWGLTTIVNEEGAVVHEAIVRTSQNNYIAYAQYYLKIHIIILAIAAVLIALLPVYTKMLRAIKTSIDIEDNGEMGAIDLTGED